MCGNMIQLSLRYEGTGRADLGQQCTSEVAHTGGNIAQGVEHTFLSPCCFDFPHTWILVIN